MNNFTLQTHVYKVPVADGVAVGPRAELEASSSVLPLIVHFVRYYQPEKCIYLLTVLLLYYR